MSDNQGAIVVINKLQTAPAKPVFLKTLSVIPKDTQQSKIPKKFTDVFERNYAGVSVWYFFNFNIDGIAYFWTVIFNIFFLNES